MYIGTGPNLGRSFPDEQLWLQVMAECGIAAFQEDAPLAAEFKEAVQDWYLSGDWKHIDDERFESLREEFGREVDKELAAGGGVGFWPLSEPDLQQEWEKLAI